MNAVVHCCPWPWRRLYLEVGIDSMPWNSWRCWQWTKKSEYLMRLSYILNKMEIHPCLEDVHIDSWPLEFQWPTVAQPLSCLPFPQTSHNWESSLNELTAKGGSTSSMASIIIWNSQPNQTRKNTKNHVLWKKNHPCIYFWPESKFKHVPHCPLQTDGSRAAGDVGDIKPRKHSVWLKVWF